MSVIGAARYSRAWLGVAVALAAGAAFAIANTSAGVAYQSGSNPLTVASTRFLLPAVALIAWLGFTGVPLVLPRREAIVAVLLGALTALYNWALLGSFNSIPFALAVLIVYFYPLIAAVIVATFGWEKFAWRTGAAILLAIVGLAMALDVRGGNLNVSGVSLAFVAAVGLAVVVAVSIRVFGNGDARPVGRHHDRSPRSSVDSRQAETGNTRQAGSQETRELELSQGWMRSAWRAPR